MATAWSIFFGWLPAWVQIVFLLIVSILLIMLIVRIVSTILEALPFL